MATQATVRRRLDQHHGEDGVRRRDFLNVAAVSFAGVGGLAALAPLIVQMNPSADVLALASTEIDISKVVPGQGIKVAWRKQPVFVRNLTPKEIAEANAVPLSELRDPQTLAERTKPGKQNWLITMGVCTHLGCVPAGHQRGREPRPLRRLFLSLPRTAPMTPRPGSGRARRRSTCRCPTISSHRRPSSRSAEGTRDE